MQPCVAWQKDCITSSGGDVEIYGFEEGYKGLIYNEYRLMTGRDFSGILTRGGTILGSSRQSFKTMRTPDENGLDKVAAMKQNYTETGPGLPGNSWWKWNAENS